MQISTSQLVGKELLVTPVHFQIHPLGRHINPGGTDGEGNVSYVLLNCCFFNFMLLKFSGCLAILTYSPISLSFSIGDCISVRVLSTIKVHTCTESCQYTYFKAYTWLPLSHLLQHSNLSDTPLWICV